MFWMHGSGGSKGFVIVVCFYVTTCDSVFFGTPFDVIDTVLESRQGSSTNEANVVIPQGSSSGGGSGGSSRGIAGGNLLRHFGRSCLNSGCCNLFISVVAVFVVLFFVLSIIIDVID